MSGHAKRQLECSTISEVVLSTCSLLTDCTAAAPMVGTIMPQYGSNPKSLTFSAGNVFEEGELKL